MDPIFVIVSVIVALVVGSALGWIASGRIAAPLREQIDRMRRQGEEGDAEARRTVEDMRRTLDSVVKERDEAQIALAELRADARNHEKQVAQLLDAKEALAAQFSEVGTKLLGEAQSRFLERANERFVESEKLSAERLKQLMQPVGERLKAYEEQVGKVEKDRTEAYGTLTGLIDQMRAGQDRVQTEAARLVNSLRNAPKARGRWGEQQLKNVLESCGLAEHTDFQTEVSIDSEEGRLRPDAIITVPGGRSLVIDAKVSLNDYQDAFNADDDEGRLTALARHCASMKAHIEGLSRKAYWSQFDEAPDYVIMFVPGEHFLTAALEHDATLWDHAFEKRVLLATPTNLIAIARTVSAVWRQEGLAREAKQIGQLGKDMYDRLAVAAGHLKTVGTGLTTAVANYNKFVGSFDRNVMSTARKFQELNIETGKRELEDVLPVEITARQSDTEALPEPDGEREEAAE